MRLLIRLRPYGPVLLLLLLGLCYRAAYLGRLAQLPDWDLLLSDEEYYLQAARALLQPGPCQPFHLSPLLTAVLALHRRLLGEGPLGWRLALLATGLCGALLSYGVARRSLGERAALWALGLYLLCGPLVFYETNLDVATLASSSALLALYAALRWQQGGSWGWWALAGVGVGVGITARPSGALLCLPLFIGPLWLRAALPRKQRVLLALLGVAVALACTAPVTLHNWRCEPDLVWISDSAGLNLYIGNHREATGTFSAPPRVPDAVDTRSQQRAFQRAAEQALGRGLSAAQVSRYWTGEALAEIGAEPGRWLRLLWVKLQLVFHGAELASTRSYELRQEVMGPALAWPLWPARLAHLTPLALLGLLLVLRDVLLCRDPRHFFLASFTLCFVAALVLFFVLGHYRQVLIPLLIQLAVLGGQRLAGWRRPRALLVLPLLVLMSVWASRPLLARSSRADDAFKHAYGLHLRGDDAGAERWYLESLRAAPTHLSAARNLALLYTRQRRGEAAQRLWRHVLKVALAQHRFDQAEEAERYLERLRGLAPP